MNYFDPPDKTQSVSKPSRKRPTIQELDAILNSPEQPNIQVMPEGSVSVIGDGVGQQLAKRFRLVQDDSSHWYAIPSDKREAFDKWVLCASQEAFDGPYEPYTGETFDEYRLGMHVSNYTLTDLEEGR